MAKLVSIGVREFALPVPRTGSIEAHSGYGPLPQQGAEIHAEIQARRVADHSDYRGEVALTWTFEAGAFKFRVNGRVDGLFERAVPLVEEIKSAFDAAALCEALRERPEHPYWLQLQTYAYCYWKKHERVPACKMLVVSSRTQQITEIDHELDIAAYEAWLERRLAELVVHETRLRAREKRRKKIAAELQFPFAQARPGQTALMQLLSEAPPETRHFLIQAPTGMGKTLGITLPLLREALGRGGPLLYLTPKNSQHRVAEHAVGLIQKAAGKNAPRALTLTAKSRICMQAEPVCNPQHCQFARDYYKKVAEHDLVERTARLGKKKPVNELTLRRLAERYEVCPYELSLDAAPAFDIVVGDYNYVIQPHGLPGRIEGERRGREAQASLVIDEAHNLFPRANDNLSASVSRRTLAEFGEELASLAADLKFEGRQIVSAAQELITAAAPRGGASTVQLEMLEERAHWRELAARMAGFVARYLAQTEQIQQRDPVLRLSAYLMGFAGALEGEGDAFVCVYEHQRDGECLRVICCDAAPHLKEALAPFTKVVGFSATLKPFDYYARLSGFDLTALATAEFTSPFPPDNRKVLVIPQVSTKLRDRSRNMGKIGDAIMRLVRVRPGNYMAFFPSFQFLADAAQKIDLPEFRVILQTPAMSRAEVTACLAALLEEGAKPTLVLGVQGGALAEGVDYPGEQLIGAIIVGPALPSFDLPREILRDYYDKHYEHKGMDYAYTFPAMAKVVQAAGRVIRTESDRGLIVLMDARFVEARYSALFPRDWFKDSVRELVSTKILHEVEAFWASPGKGGGLDAP